MGVTKILFSILAVVLCVSGAFAATTTYELVTPDENLSLGYSQNNYYKLGDLKVTATESFDTSYKVVVTVSRDSAFTNQSADKSTLAYDLVISPDMTTIKNGDSFDFSAASIDAKQGLEIGTKVTADFLTAADGFYMDSLTFKASLDNAAPAGPVVGSTMTFGTYNSAAIKWRVLTVDETNNRALLITEQAIVKSKYHDSSNAWGGSTVRGWLRDSFLTNTNFTADEQAKILSVTIDTSTRDITAWGSGDDKMFLLSIAEANKYFTSNDDRKCTLLSDNSASSWWLRSPGNDASYAAIVTVVGAVNALGSFVSDARGVRPAFWLNLE